VRLRQGLLLSGTGDLLHHAVQRFEVLNVEAADELFTDKTGTLTRAGQLASDRAVPARQGDQIAAAISGH
jgi:hypothetical protein